MSNMVVRGMAAIDLLANLHSGKNSLIPPDLRDYRAKITRKLFNQPILVHGKEVKGTRYIVEDNKEKPPVYTEEELKEYAASVLMTHYNWVHENYGAKTAQEYYDYKNMEEQGVKRQIWPLCDKDLFEEEDEDNIKDDDDADCMNDFQCDLTCPFFDMKGCTYENYI